MNVEELMERLSSCDKGARVMINFNRPEPNWLIDIDAVYDCSDIIEISIYPDGMEEVLKLEEYEEEDCDNQDL